MNKQAFIWICCVFLIFCSCSYESPEDQTVTPPVTPPEPKPEWSQAYKEALYQPNCYMVKPGDQVEIPIMKAYAVWGIYADELGNTKLEDSKPTPIFLWQDSPNLITELSLNGEKNANGFLSITTGNKRGNAVVGIQLDGITRWSWHLWITPYNPEKEINGRIYPWDNNGDGIADYIWMDRNLGAKSNGTQLNYTDSLAACGLLYQWGRKDPFPGDSKLRNTNEAIEGDFDTMPIYDALGNPLPEVGLSTHHIPNTGIRSEEITNDYSTTNLAKSIMYPMTFYLGHFNKGNSSSGDWYKTENGDFNHELWGKSGDKTPFDPCPKGWRVPPEKNDLSPWNNLTDATTPYSKLGVFPYAGFRYIHSKGATKNSGFQTILWSAISIESNHVAQGRAWGLSIYNSSSSSINLDISSKTTGASVRCVKEDF